jgi:CRP-like cAMP-binding protein
MPQHATKAWYVERTHLLQKLNEADLALFQGQSTIISLAKGDSIDPSLQQQGCVYLITEGFAKLVTLSPEGKRFSLAILNVGDFMGTVLGNANDVYNEGLDTEPEEFLEAMAPCQLLRVSNECFRSVLENNPTLFMTVLQNIQGKTRLLQRKLSELLFKDVHARIAQLFLDLMFTHGAECPYAFGLTRDLCLRHHEIAELIGASRPVTSSALSDFAKADLIHKHDGLICLNHMEAIHRVAEDGFKGLLSLNVKVSSI